VIKKLDNLLPCSSRLCGSSIDSRASALSGLTNSVSKHAVAKTVDRIFKANCRITEIICVLKKKNVALILFPVQTKLGADEFQGHLCACLSLHWRLCSYLSPLHIHSPPTLGPNIPRVLFPRPLGGDSPPQPWARGGVTYYQRATAPTLFVFVLTATCSMLRRDLTPGLAPSHHPCMQNYTSLPPPLHPHSCTP